MQKCSQCNFYYNDESKDPCLSCKADITGKPEDWTLSNFKPKSNDNNNIEAKSNGT